MALRRALLRSAEISPDRKVRSLSPSYPWPRFGGSPCREDAESGARVVPGGAVVGVDGEGDGFELWRVGKGSYRCVLARGDESPQESATAAVNWKRGGI